MKTKNTPEVTHLKLGDAFKVLQVTGSAGMNMPEHISTKEAVVVVQRGSATLRMKGVDHLLKLNESFIVPAGVKHELHLTDDFQAIVIMDIDSEIKFISIQKELIQ